MAYGNTNSQANADLGLLSGTVDQWLNKGSTGINLFSGHSPFVAVLWDNSQEPGGDYQFRVEEGGLPDAVKINVWGSPQNYSAGVTPVAGVTRANQVTALTPSVATTATNAKYTTAHYQGIAWLNDNDVSKNSGPYQMIDLAEQVVGQVKAAFFELVANHLEDGTAGAEDRIMAINYALANSGQVGGIDQTDSTNNAWWRAQADATVEVINTGVIDRAYDLCTFNTGMSTGISKMAPDVAFLGPGTNGGNTYTTIRQELKQSQRVEVEDMLKGGAKYILYNGMRCFRTTRITAGQALILNSSTWALRLGSKTPKPVAPTFVPSSGRPGMYERGYNWYQALACYSPKHNALLTNKQS